MHFLSVFSVSGRALAPGWARTGDLTSGGLWGAGGGRRGSQDRMPPDNVQMFSAQRNILRALSSKPHGGIQKLPGHRK